jgi:hypothetical protein
LRDLDIAPADVALYQELAGAIIIRTKPSGAGGEGEAVTLGQEALWARGISGDLPIVLATIARRRASRASGGCSWRTDTGAKGIQSDWSS